jgi:NTE family protein
MRPKIGLALGGGGARGYAHIGIIRTLVAHGIPIDMIAGTSMGAAVGAVYACGWEMAKFESVLRRLDLNRLLKIPDTPMRGLETFAGTAASEFLFKRADWRHHEPDRVKDLLNFLILFSRNKEFAELNIPFAAVACDVDTGQEIILRTGKVHRAVAASMAMPGLQQPIQHEGRFLIDGGLVNKIPVDVAVQLGAEIVIAVDVSAALSHSVQTSIDVLVQSQAILSNELAKVKLQAMRERLGDRLIVVTPAVEHIKIYSLRQFAPAIAAGEQAVLEKIDLIKTSIEQRTVPTPSEGVLQRRPDLPLARQEEETPAS